MAKDRRFTRPPLRVGVLVSGSGTNLQAILDASAAGKINVQVVKVVASNPEAYGLVRAQKAGIPTYALQRADYAEPRAADEAIVAEMRRAGAEYLAMAGYMRKVTDVILDAYPDKVLNLHPALLPSFVGAHAIADAYEAGVKVTGVTVHFANAEYDKGPVIAQKAVKVKEGDTLDDLEARIHKAEHKLYPKVLGWLADGRVSLDDHRKVHIGGKGEGRQLENPQVKRVLVSVTDKTGVAEFAKALSEEFGATIISTGGTARTIAAAGVPVVPIDEVTGFPEMMDGRVKTLHPKVHGGLLARRDDEKHMAEAAEHGIEMIDMVVVNLYAFTKTVESGADFDTCIENIDIGGPSMLRSAAKNHASVAVVTDPASYDDILAEMRANGGATTAETRRKLALKVFQTTGAYDTAISQWMAGQLGETDPFPETLDIQLTKQQELRYGENPHQSAAFYRRSTATPHSLVNAEQLNGKPLSYNNLLDTDACWTICREFEEPAVIILKHQNPCGSANGKDIVEAFDRAFACDTKSAFGGIIAANKTVTTEMVEHIQANGLFVEVLIAPDFEQGALDLLAQKPNLRVLKTGGIDALGAEPEFRTVDGGVLIQDIDTVSEDPVEFTVPTKRKPTDKEMDDLMFAWKVVKGVKSNAILVAKDHAGIGMGPGQPNRVDSAAIACKRAGEECKGAVAASDAFFPFRDNVDTLAECGITAIIQPGGSIRDEESIQAADEHGIAMVFTGHRHFRH